MAKDDFRWGGGGLPKMMDDDDGLNIQDYPNQDN